jgi:hypothetical protein
MWLYSCSTSIIEDRDPSTHLNILTTRLLISAGAVPAQTIVVGTGNPDIDVSAVQAAVDQGEGGRALLMGHFSFDKAPTTPAGATYPRMITVSKPVDIAGAFENQQGVRATIERGYIPFWVEAPGVRVSIQGVRFVRPTGTVVVVAASGLTIANCSIEGVEVEPEVFGPGTGTGSVAIYVGTLYPGIPSKTNPGQPEKISGNLLIVNNDIDLQGVENTITLGIAVSAIGKSPDREVDLYISGNNIRNSTERPMDLYLNDGRAYIERNAIKTGTIMRPGGGVSPLINAIHVLRHGSYLIANNTIDCGYANGAAIRVGENGGTGTIITLATVVDNDIAMSAPGGTVFGNESAGIEIRGYAQGNVVTGNTIRGHSRVGLSVVASGAAIPASNSFVSNSLDGFKGTFTGAFVSRRNQYSSGGLTREYCRSGNGDTPYLDVELCPSAL